MKENKLIIYIVVLIFVLFMYFFHLLWDEYKKPKILLSGPAVSIDIPVKDGAEKSCSILDKVPINHLNRHESYRLNYQIYQIKKGLKQDPDKTPPKDTVLKSYKTSIDFTALSSETVLYVKVDLPEDFNKEEYQIIYLSSVKKIKKGK